jgi:archaellum component FlaC
MSGECDDCGEHCLDCKCKNMREIMKKTADERLEGIEHQLWHLVEDVKEMSREMNTFSRLFCHVHDKEIPRCMAEMYKLTIERNKRNHDTVEDLDKDLLINGLRDLIERFGKDEE